MKPYHAETDEKITPAKRDCPATDEHLERLRERVSGEGQALATSAEIRQVLARIDADRALNAEMLTVLERTKEHADHQIPYYAYGDNEAGVDMSNRLENIHGWAEEIIEKAKAAR